MLSKFGDLNTQCFGLQILASLVVFWGEAKKGWIEDCMPAGSKVTENLINFVNSKILIFVLKLKVMNPTVNTLSNAQVEILKLLADNLSEAELADLKKILLAFKLQRVVQLADKTWDENGWSQETMNKFLQTHMRTPYQREKPSNPQ